MGIESTCSEYFEELITIRGFPIFYNLDINLAQTKYSTEEIQEAFTFLTLKHGELFAPAGKRILREDYGINLY